MLCPEFISGSILLVHPRSDSPPLEGDKGGGATNLAISKSIVIDIETNSV